MIVRRNCCSWFTAIFAILAVASVAGASVPSLQSAVSRLTHGSGVGAMDVQLPLTGGSGVECRQVSGGMKIVLYFDQPVFAGTNFSVAVTAGATVGTATFPAGTNTMIVPLTSVANASSLTVTVNNVKNAGNENLPTASVPLRVLLGDINGDGNITASDTNICRAAVASSFPVNGANFHCDINLDGNLTSSDTNLIRAAAAAGASAQSGTVTNDTAPTITDIANQTAYIGQTSSPVSFAVNGTVADPSTLGVVASSSDQTIVPNSGIVITGSGTSRSLTITPVSTLTTSSTITITMYSSDGLLTSAPVSFTVYVTPPPTIFLATLTPTAAATAGANQKPPGLTSLGTGVAVLTVAGDLSHANLVYSFSNLAGNDTDDQIFGPGNVVGLYDVPTLATAKNVQGDGSILWTFKATVNLTIAQQLAIIFNTGGVGPANMTISSSAFPSGELSGTFQKIVGSQTFTPPATPTPLTIDPPTPADASRFLQQAGFGGTIAEINALSNAADPNASTALEHWIALQEASQPPISPVWWAMCPKYSGPGYDSTGTADTNPNYHTPALGQYYSSSSIFLQLYNRASQAQTSPDPYAPGGDGVNDDMVNEAWWTNTVTAPDELRQRIATAYTELFVISQIDTAIDDSPYSLAAYYDMFANDAFANFRTIMSDVTLHPLMGDYLNMMGNDYFTYNGQSFAPNENYAREIMQLFTIGLYMLQPDGTLMLNSSGQPIATYTQPTISQFAAVYTGFDGDHNADYTVPNIAANGTITQNVNPNYGSGYYGPLTVGVVNAGQSYATTDHYQVSKSLLNYTGAPTYPGASQPGFIPATTGNGTAAVATAELNFALDDIFKHPNVGPFVCKQLIQRLVTSNPSPAYVYRVAQVFANDGTNTRGNMGAVIKAILTDNEARSPVVRAEPGFGKVREPMVRLAQMFHSLQAKSNSGKYILGNLTNDTNPISQTLFWSPTVFNYFTPTYQQPGAIQQAGLVSPEMNIIYETTIVNAQNLIYTGIYTNYNSSGAPTFTGGAGFQGSGGRPYPWSGQNPDIALDFSSSGNGLLSIASGSGGVGALVDQVGLLLMGTETSASGLTDAVMDPTMRSTIVNYINNPSNHITTPIAQVEAAVHLVATSSQATVQN